MKRTLLVLFTLLFLLGFFAKKLVINHNDLVENNNTTVIREVMEITCIFPTGEILEPLPSPALIPHNNNEDIIQSVKHYVKPRKLKSIFLSSKLSSKEAFMGKLYRFESGNNPKATNKKNTNFGLCQASDYWGEKMLDESWDRENTPRELQETMCEGMYDIYIEYLKDNNIPINDLTIYYTHQQGTGAILSLISFLRDEEEHIRVDVLANMLGNIRGSDLKVVSNDLIKSWLSYTRKHLR